MYDPLHSSLGICSNKFQLLQKMHTLMLMTVLFIIAITWKQPRYSSGDEQTDRWWHIPVVAHTNAQLSNAKSE